MTQTYNLGILGCGDFLRWMQPGLEASRRVAVTALFDLDPARAAHYAAELGGAVAESDADILDDPEIDIVGLFVPPWARRDLLLRAVRAGKHVLTTKPLAPTVDACAAMVTAVEEGPARCGVIYGRTGNAGTEALKRVFASGEIGRLALYKQDWLHHYPQWNQWALDPERNGGPFMDAMIHNLNAARYLMGRPATHCTYFSDNHAHPDLACNDTELMKLDFAGGGAAHLFITWAADLAVYSTEGNDREHIDLFYMITDQGWRVTTAWEEAGFTITASKEGETRQWVADPLPDTVFDRFADVVARAAPLPPDIVDIRMAAEDIVLLRGAEQRLGTRFPVSFDRF
jgi:predicted dehydrogenase